MNVFLMFMLLMVSQQELPYKPDGKVGVSEINKNLSWAVGTAGSIIKVAASETTDVAIAIKGFDQKVWDFNDVCFADTTHGWIVGQKNTGTDKGKGIIIQTTNGGIRWITSFTPFNNTPDSLLPCLKIYILKINEQYQGYIDCGKYSLRLSPFDYRWLPRRPHSRNK